MSKRKNNEDQETEVEGTFSESGETSEEVEPVAVIESQPSMVTRKPIPKAPPKSEVKVIRKTTVVATGHPNWQHDGKTPKKGEKIDIDTSIYDWALTQGFIEK